MEGLGFRAIGRFLKTSHVSVYKWIKNFGEKIGNLQSGNEIKVVEMDELHSYIGQKKDIAKPLHGKNTIIVVIAESYLC